MENNDQKPSRSSIGKIIQGILAGALGIQSQRLAQKDFENESPLLYIIAGILFTLLFIGILVSIVTYVLH